MIPKNIKKAHILEAITYIDENGVPKNRFSTKYNIKFQGRLYPPKYVISLANKYVNGNMLKSEEFGGGLETNGFLRALSFEIVGGYEEKIETKVLTKVTADSLKIATCSYETRHGLFKEKKNILIEKLISELKNEVDVLLLPAGYFQLNDYSYENINVISNNLVQCLKAVSSDLIICVGIDCNYSENQLAVAVGKDGIRAFGRKFYPTEDEKETVKLADSYLDEELNYKRIFEVKGRKAYLAVCYDSFGIRKKKLENPGVDFVLNMIHRFVPKGEGGSGEVYFAKHGLAGASKQWNCPVFGAAMFKRREVPINWPTGVIWNQGDISTKFWKYSDNILEVHSEQKMEFETNTVNIKIYDI
jgi:hypothetical protein